MTITTDRDSKSTDKTASKPLNGCTKEQPQRPTRAEAEEAVRTLIAWAGDDPTRDGLIDTPSRVVKAYREFFKGYDENPEEILARNFEEDAGYKDMVMLRDIDMSSHCEHHMVPFIGKVHIAYYPAERVVGISKLARIVDTYAKRLQTQETMTAQIANALDHNLATNGCAVMIEAVHQCMSLRGVQKPNVATITTHFTGIFEQDPNQRDWFMRLIKE